MTLRQILTTKKAEVAEFQKQIEKLNSEISAIEKVLAIPGLDDAESSLVPPRTDDGLIKTYGTFAKFIKQFMLDNGLSHKDFAKLLNVAGSTVSWWASGRTLPKRGACAKIAETIQDLSANEYTSAEILRLIQEEPHLTDWIRRK